MPSKATLNRFPLFGLFAYRAARHMGYAEDDARLLGYSTALLYAIFKAQAQAKREGAEKKEKPKEKKEEKLDSLIFGGKEFQVVFGKGKHLKQTLVGHELHVPADYQSEIEAKFPEGWHERLAKEFDKYLATHDPEELNTGKMLFDLYKAWRDENKVGFNRVDLEKLLGWLKEREAKR
jgi:hypothetical protein